MDAYEDAKNGGKHFRFYQDYVIKTDRELRKGIRSYDKQIAKHQDKIANPEKYIPHYRNLIQREQNNLVNEKWPKDIARLQTQKAILEGILKERSK